VPLVTGDPEPQPTGPSRSEIMRVAPPAEELALAERDLRAALASDPTLIEARLRLAHVLSALGRTADAAEQARIPPDARLPPFLDYYGAMVLGRAEADLGRHAEARAAFEHAARLLPRSQSPRVALSRLAIADGRTGDGIATIVAASGPDARGDAIDPWWSYFRLHAPDAKAQLTAFRERVR
jgi:tetratricopeptide (TPR) repeat protein